LIRGAVFDLAKCHVFSSSFWIFVLAFVVVISRQLFMTIDIVNENFAVDALSDHLVSTVVHQRRRKGRSDTWHWTAFSSP